MRKLAMRVPRKRPAFLGIGALTLGALLVMVSCHGGGGNGGGGGGGGGVTPPQIACASANAAAAGTVALTCAGATGSQTEDVTVVLGGPSSGTVDLNGLNFDVTYDPTKLAFVPAANYASALFPNALVAVALLNGAQGTVVVSIQQPGNLPAVTVGPGQYPVLRLSFAAAAGQAGFGPTAVAFQNAEPTPAAAGITFSSNLLISYQ